MIEKIKIYKLFSSLLSRKLCFVLLLNLIVCISLRAQLNLHQQSTQYEWPSDPLVKEKLEKWRDQKFGMIIHWGLYAVPGIIESWGICSEDWIERDSSVAYDKFKEWYWGLKKDFNPVSFNPDLWANAAKAAGMRYVVFTTKHHDGFCMFDTKETSFKISDGPFAKDPRANVAKYVFDAFRKQDFMIGAYFSKPDWHCEYYWWPKYATADRNNNYDIRKYPWRWNQYKQFTYNQISELMHDYGAVDILWLDGGWIRPLETVNDEVLSWGARIPPWSQDIDMPGIAGMARKAQPGLLIVDRTVHGPYENYQTPEQKIPAKKINYPWESCITLGTTWGYSPNDTLKSSVKVIHSLIEIVAKGGSLLLGVGPGPDGTLSDAVVKRLAEIGKWLSVNGEGIYNTRSVTNCQDGSVYFTQGKNELYYALACIPEDKPLPPIIEWTGNVPKPGTKIKLLQTGKTVKWTLKEKKIRIVLPEELLKTKVPALVFVYKNKT